MLWIKPKEALDQNVCFVNVRIHAQNKKYWRNQKLTFLLVNSAKDAQNIAVL